MTQSGSRALMDKALKKASRWIAWIELQFAYLPLWKAERTHVHNLTLRRVSASHATCHRDDERSVTIARRGAILQVPAYLI